MKSILSFFLHLDQHIGFWFQQYGAWGYALVTLVVFCETGLVILPFLPGDSLLFVLGMLSNHGHLHFFLCFALLSCAAILGDAVNYTIGRKFGNRVLSSRWINPNYIEKTRSFFEKHGGKTVVLGRFIPIIRTFAPFVAGIGHMPYRSFFIYNVTGAIIWVFFFLGLGYFLGKYEWIQKHFSLFAIGVVILSALPGLIQAIYTRFRSKNETVPEKGSTKPQNNVDSVPAQG